LQSRSICKAAVIDFIPKQYKNQHLHKQLIYR
jgi:hypothetical protein